MVLHINPFCPISFGFLGLLSAVVSGRGALGKQKDTGFSGDRGEDDLLMSKKEDDECDELNEDKISRFLETQREKYYQSIGMNPPTASKPAQTNMNTSSSTSCTDFSTPSQSMIEFPSSRETSLLIDESLIDPSLISISSVSNTQTNSNVQSFCIDTDLVSPLPSDDDTNAVVQFRTTTANTIVEDDDQPLDLLAITEEDNVPQKKSKRQSNSRRSQTKKST